MQTEGVARGAAAGRQVQGAESKRRMSVRERMANSDQASLNHRTQDLGQVSADILEILESEMEMITFNLSGVKV